MANKSKSEKDSTIKMGPLKKIASMIQRNNDVLYKSTYYSDPANERELETLKNSINTSIQNIIDTNTDNTGETNISRLYERLLLRTQNDPDTVKEFEKIFGDNEFVNNLTNSYLDNRWVGVLNDEIDEVLKYMPKLEEALQTIKDNVLSADSFSKDFLNIEGTLQGNGNTEQFDRNIAEMKDKYKLLDLTSTTYYNASKYGEEFIYCVPYDKAIQGLLDRKKDRRSMIVKGNISEGTIFIDEDSSSFASKLTKSNTINNKEELINLNIEIHNGVIESVVESEKGMRKKMDKISKLSLTEQFYQEAVDITNDGKSYSFDKITNNDIEMGAKLPVHHNFDHTLADDLELPQQDDTTSDGLYTKKSENTKIKKMNGCIVKKLPPENVIPILLNEICLGYYYFEFNAETVLFQDKFNTTGMINTITGLRSNGRSEAFDAQTRRTELLQHLSAQLADKIDADFINQNQDLKKEIYHILKYNDDFLSGANGESQNIRVTYIPPEDIHHIHFTLDEKTGRGVSDLSLSLIPAKLWVAIYITNALGIMTRGNDKRVYYVKQSVESNISKTLLKTINEIKKSNFGIRQINSINNVLNISGRFNDWIIPRGADGSSPVEFEVMQGQQIEIKTELLNLLEEAAINVTGVPIELIQNRQSPEYAIQLTMQNSKFLRFVYTRQSSFQQQMSLLYTRIYNIEYNTTDRITLTLPPPLFINVTNTNQLITNTAEFCNQIVEVCLADSQDDVLKAKVGKNLKVYYLGSYINMSVVEQLIEKSKQEIAKEEVMAAGDEEEG